MENNLNHIDSFLFQKILTLNVEPDKDAWDFISHTLHPADNALEEQLGKLEDSPGELVKKAVFASIENNIHPIDIALHDRFSEFEPSYAPEIPLAKDEKRKRKGLFLWLAFPIAIGLSVLLYKQINHNNQKDNNTLQSQQQSANSDNLPESIQKPMEKPDKEIPEGRSHIAAVNKNRTKTLQSRPIDIQDEPVDPPVFEFINDEFDDQSLTYESFASFPVRYEFENLQKTKLKNRKGIKSRILPFGFYAGIGYIVETTGQNKVDNASHIHKDEISNYSAFNSSARNGIQLVTSLVYSPGSRFRFKAGMQYSSSSAKKTYSYTYTDIPIFWTDGSIIGYFKRPASASPSVNEEVKTSFTSLSLPFEVSYRILKFKHFSAWTGGSADFVLMNAYQSKVFNFSSGNLSDIVSVKTGKLRPGLQLQFVYEVKPGLSFNLQVQNQNRNQSVYGENTIFNSKVSSFGFSVGLLFHPFKFYEK